MKPYRPQTCKTTERGKASVGSETRFWAVEREEEEVAEEDGEERRKRTRW